METQTELSGYRGQPDMGMEETFLRESAQNGWQLCIREGVEMWTLPTNKKEGWRQDKHKTQPHGWAKFHHHCSKFNHCQ